jgi:hypothetical protein
MNNKPETIKKLEAARRQLSTGIELWFRNGDAVSIHTLICAAHGIIHSVFRKRGFKNLFFDSDHFKEEYRSLIMKTFKSKASFFKHAQYDPDGEIEFNSEINVAVICICIEGLLRMGEGLTLIERAYWNWIWLSCPDFFPEPKGSERLPVEFRELFRTMPKLKFFEEFTLIYGKAIEGPDS